MLFHYFCNAECILYLVDLGPVCAFYVLNSKTSSRVLKQTITFKYPLMLQIFQRDKIGWKAAFFIVSSFQ